MNKSLLFLPDISGYTKFIHTTEVEHSQHVIAELLEILLDANKLGFEVAEIEGDAIFFYMENEVVSSEMLLAQVEAMFTAFYSHLKLLETNRICPCRACATAPNLELKIVAHCGELQFITVQENRKPFGTEVIEVHRLMKNSVDSSNYCLLSQSLMQEIALSENYQSKLFNFQLGKDTYDEREVNYAFSLIDQSNLKLKPFTQAKKYTFEKPFKIHIQREFPVAGSTLFEYLSNYRHRANWVKGVDQIFFDEDKVTRVGTEHKCVIKGSDLDFVAITKEGKPGQVVYGELTTSPAPIDELYQFFTITPKTSNFCLVDIEVYWKVKSPFKKLLMATLGKLGFKKNANKSMDELLEYAKNPIV